MVKMGAFEKMPKQGSITAKDLGAAINLEPGIVGKYSLPFNKTQINRKPNSAINEDAYGNRYHRLGGGRYLRAYPKINDLSRRSGRGLLQLMVR